MKMAKTLGSVVKRQRQAFSLTQRELARKLGVKASHVAYIEGGRRKPSLSLLSRIADVLGLQFRDLFLLSHPEAKNLVGDSLAAEKNAPEGPKQSWQKFTRNRALLARYHVTPRELRALKGLSLLGYVLTPREFVAILALVRSTSED
jgi:transcriptional regulator with XRE-family HTH domain